MDELSETGARFERLFAADDNSAIEDFHERTKWTPVLERTLAQRLQLFLHSPQLRRVIAGTRKRMPLLARLAQQAIEARRSLFNQAPARGPRLGLEDLAAILRFSYGVTGTMGGGGQGGPDTPLQPLRATASAGALYPLEIYVVAFDVDGLAPGLYHYDATGHALGQLRREDMRSAFPPNELQPDLMARANAVLVVSAVMMRTVAKYRERGYRFVMNDCGALIQSLYLTAAARGVAACAWGGFCDDRLADFLALDNRSEVVCMGFVLGAHLA
jgi:SagB-type dehydrogenase family enzyme